MIIGCSGIEIYEHMGFLRSLAVKSTSQGQGIGQKRVSSVEKLAYDLDIRQLYLLIETAKPFFYKIGYQKIPRSSTDIQIQQTHEFTTLCPSTPVMVKDLRTIY